MMSGFGSHYLNLVSITLYTIPTSSSFFREKVFKILVNIYIYIYIYIYKYNISRAQLT